MVSSLTRSLVIGQTLGRPTVFESGLSFFLLDANFYDNPVSEELGEKVYPRLIPVSPDLYFLISVLNNILKKKDLVP